MRLVPIARRSFWHRRVETCPGPAAESSQRAGRLSPACCVRRALGIGLVTGWLELGLVLAVREIDPRIPMAALRTNRHFPWMIPVSNLCLLGVVGLVVALLARRRPAVGSWFASWIYLALGAAALLLEVEGLHPVACLTLATGIGMVLGPRMMTWISRFDRPARVLVLLLGMGLVPLTIITYGNLTLAESRALAALPPARSGSPNVIVIVLDNVRAASLSLLGRDRPTTPNLERLARSGVLFTQARSTSSWTLPAHASLFTGRWCHELAFDFDRALAPNDATLAETLADQGYATAGFVANTYYGNLLYGLGRGFARYEDHYENLAVTPFEVLRSTGLGKVLLGALGYPILVEQGASIRKNAAMINRDALNWLDHRPAARPFFLFLNYFDAHAPFIPPEGQGPRFGMAALPVSEQAEVFLKDFRLSTGERKPAGGPGSSGQDQARRNARMLRLDCYESCIAYLDSQIGRLFDELDRRGLRENTLIVLTSDHGEHLGERGFHGHGLSLYDAEVRIPLLVFPPASAGAPARRVIDEPVSLRDVAATVVDVLKPSVPAARRLPGQSLARLWTARDTAESSFALLMHLGRRKDLQPSEAVPASAGPLRALLADGMVYIRNGEGREELFDLARDPAEESNLIGKPTTCPEVLSRFRSDFDSQFASPSQPQ